MAGGTAEWQNAITGWSSHAGITAWTTLQPRERRTHRRPLARATQNDAEGLCVGRELRSPRANFDSSR